VVFGFFSVVGKGKVFAQTGQFNRHSGGQRDAFVGRAKNHVKLDPAFDQALCIKFSQTAQLGTVVKQTRVEKIRAQTTCLGFELTKAQNA
jgi:hypothetical protein